MAIYARHPGRLAGQVAADLFVLGWIVACAWLGRAVRDLIAAVAEPARQTGAAAARIAGDLRDAGAEIERVPGVGDELRRPLDSAAGTVADLVAAADQQVATVERLAGVAGWLVFVIPVVLVLVAWLPRRIAFVVRSRAAQRFLDSPADLDLFALRAMASQPLHVLARISDDPAGAWRSGDRAVLDRLAELELRRDGLRPPVLARDSPRAQR